MSVDNIDRDLFGRAVKGAMYQPSDETSDNMRTAAQNLMLSAYEDNLVCSYPNFTYCKSIMNIFSNASLSKSPCREACGNFRSRG